MPTSKPSATERALEIAEGEMIKHFDTLARSRMLLVRKDQYGVESKAAWSKELTHFFNQVIIAHMERKKVCSAKNVEAVGNVVLKIWDKRLAKRAAEISKASDLGEGLSGADYEAHCAALLEAAGWMASLTKASGDQGADIVARRGNEMIVIQCKLYGAPVGNKAVQEVVAARSHLKARHAAVVSNASYTRAAQELASTTATLLLHHSELSGLHQRLGFPPEVALE